MKYITRKCGHDEPIRVHFESTPSPEFYRVMQDEKEDICVQCKIDKLKKYYSKIGGIKYWLKNQLNK